MARTHTLKDRVKQIIGAYKKITHEKFLYNKRDDLRKRYHRIRVWYLLNSKARGYSIMRMEFTRKVHFGIHQWHTLFAKGITTKERRYDSLHSIFTQAVLPAINAKGGNDWRFISVLCWTGITTVPVTKERKQAAVREFAFGDLRQTKNPTASRKRDSAPKKRTANARNRHRR
jgi:hypothetical protein